MIYGGRKARKFAAKNCCGHTPVRAQCPARFRKRALVSVVLRLIGWRCEVAAIRHQRSRNGIVLPLELKIIHRESWPTSCNRRSGPRADRGQERYTNVRCRKSGRCLTGSAPVLARSRGYHGPMQNVFNAELSRSSSMRPVVNDRRVNSLTA
jgi:hypothetical protein